jgi:hypothetical protein
MFPINDFVKKLVHGVIPDLYAPQTKDLSDFPVKGVHHIIKFTHPEKGEYEISIVANSTTRWRIEMAIFKGNRTIVSSTIILAYRIAPGST